MNLGSHPIQGFAKVDHFNATVPLMELMCFDSVCRVRSGSNEAALWVEPAKPPNVGSFQPPHSFRDMSEGFKLPAIGEWAAGAEYLHKVVELFDRGLFDLPC